jgi:hypothetical protein
MMAARPTVGEAPPAARPVVGESSVEGDCVLRQNTEIGSAPK